MTSTNVRLPDGSEAAASSLTCEGCGESMENHACGGSPAAAPTVVVSRSTGKRKDPTTRPLCPHCGGAIHFSMPGALQNAECILRQHGVATGAIADPFKRLPLATADDLANAAVWARDNGVTYGRMESAAGGAGTYAALRPKADPSERKPRARKAGKGEKIEDMAAAVIDSEGPSIVDGATITPEGHVTYSTDGTPSGIPESYEEALVVTPEPTPEPDPEIAREERRRLRREKLAAARR